MKECEVRKIDSLFQPWKNSVIFNSKINRLPCQLNQEGKVKNSGLAYNQHETLGRDPDRSWCHIHTSTKLFWLRPMAPAAAQQHTSVLPLSLWIHGLRSRKLYTSVAVTPAPIRVPTQWLLVPSFMSIVG